MAFERISDDYEDFEPEVRIWPYVALAFLLQMVPVLLSVALGEKNYFTLFLRSFYGLFPLLYTASILRHGEKPWRLALSGVLYGVMELILWVTASVGGAKGYALGLPFGLVLSPSVLSLSAYVFFQKRRRGNWLGTVLLSYLLEVAFYFMITRYSEGGIYTVYPILLGLLTTFLFFVTRRTDGTPWFIAIVLSLLVVASALFEPSFASLFFSSPEGTDIVNALLSVFVRDQHFWYTLSFLFVFSGLASKSSYRRSYDDDVISVENPAEGAYVDQTPEEPTESYPEEEENRVNYRFQDDRRDSRYSYPPEYSRFQEDEAKKKEEPVEPKEPPRVETPRSPRYEDEYRKPSSNNDKWYEFIRGGVKDEDEERHPSSASPLGQRERRNDYYREERDRREYRDPRDREYRREERRDRSFDERERDAYRRNLYDEREPYDDDRRIDGRYYEDRRRDDRYYEDRERRDYDDRRDYRDRRDDYRPSRRYDDDYDSRSRRYDDDRDRR